MIEVPETLEEWYTIVCQTPSDIYEHIPILRAFASQCQHITEFGVRYGNSTIAFLAAQPKKLISYDIIEHPEVAEIKKRQGNTDFVFKLEDSRTANIEETDLLFIDTIHTYNHVMAELSNAANKVRKYLIFHDTDQPWGQHGDGGGPGVLIAVQDFLKAHKEWIFEKHYHNCHGLSILKHI